MDYPAQDIVIHLLKSLQKPHSMISIFCTSSSCNFTFTNILNPWLEGKILWFSWSTSSHGMCISRRKAKPIIESKGLSLKRVYFRSLAARCLSRSGARFAFDLIGKICKQLPSINALCFANSEFGFVFWNRKMKTSRASECSVRLFRWLKRHTQGSSSDASQISPVSSEIAVQKRREEPENSFS